jgi:hypothetical protein
MKKLISSFLAEMQPLWLKQRQQNAIGRVVERPEQAEDIIRANPWVPLRKREPGHQMKRDTRGAQTRH